MMLFSLPSVRVFLGLAAVFVQQGSNAFSSQPMLQQRHCLSQRVDTSCLFYESQGYNGESSDDALERARKQLNGIFYDESSDSEAVNNSNNKSNDSNARIPVKKMIGILTDPANSNLDLASLLPPPPPLTSAERDRRMVELKLLEQLASSDEAFQELLHLWASEKGRQAQERLEQAEEFLAAGQVIASEQMLLRLIDEYGVYHWLEPLNRMVMVYYQQGRFQEAYQLCKAVLKLKPWHVGALEGIVEISMRLVDRDKARDWAARGLPKLIASTSFPPFASTGPANPQRAIWVQEAIQQAQEALSHLEYQTKCDFLGNPEEYYTKMASPDKQQGKKGHEKGMETTTSSMSEDDETGKATSTIMEDEGNDDAWQ